MGYFWEEVARHLKTADFKSWTTEMLSEHHYMSVVVNETFVSVHIEDQMLGLSLNRAITIYELEQLKGAWENNLERWLRLEYNKFTMAVCRLGS